MIPINTLELGSTNTRKDDSMAVIVNGMPMPESCEKCRFLCDFGSHYKICGAVDRELIVTNLYLVRHDKCPLCEVDIGAELSDGEDFIGGD